MARSSQTHRRSSHPHLSASKHLLLPAPSASWLILSAELLPVSEIAIACHEQHLAGWLTSPADPHGLGNKPCPPAKAWTIGRWGEGTR
jgi:hypothetical protein